MAPTSVSDAAPSILRVCQDGIRFLFFGGLQLPQYDWYRPELEPGPYRVRLVVAAGVPAREDGAFWGDGIGPRPVLRDAFVAAAKSKAMALAGDAATAAEVEAAGREAEVAALTQVDTAMANVPNRGRAWKDYGVKWKVGTRPLGKPAANDILLKKTIYVPPEPLWDVQFPPETEPDDVAFLSENYPRTAADGPPLCGQRVRVTQFGVYTLQWTRAERPAIDSWVAISFAGFEPNRPSADLIAPVTRGHLFS